MSQTVGETTMVTSFEASQSPCEILQTTMTTIYTQN